MVLKATSKAFNIAIILVCPLFWYNYTRIFSTDVGY